MLATQAQPANPKSVFVSPTNNEVYFTDTNHRVRKILNNGNIVTIAGCGKFGFYDDREPAIKAHIYPTCVFVSSENEVYLVDETYHAILKILQSGIMVSIAGHGYCVSRGDNGPAKDASLAFPTCVFVSSKKEVYICELNNRIRKILGNGNIITIAGNGQEGFSGDGGLAIEAQLYGPDCVFVSNNDEVYFTDCGNNRIRKILRNGIIETIAGNGKPGFNGDGSPAKEAQLNHPKGLFVLNNEVYFSDGCNHRIRKISENGTITTIAGTGQEGFSGDGGPAEEAQLQYPAGIWVSNDEVYIADEYNNRIRKILRNGHIITIAGNGEKEYNGDSEFNFSKYPHIGGKIYNYKTLFSNLILETLNELSDWSLERSIFSRFDTSKYSFRNLTQLVILLNVFSLYKYGKAFNDDDSEGFYKDGGSYPFDEQVANAKFIPYDFVPSIWGDSVTITLSDRNLEQFKWGESAINDENGLPICKEIPFGAFCLMILSENQEQKISMIRNILTSNLTENEIEGCELGVSAPNADETKLNPVCYFNRMHKWFDNNNSWHDDKDGYQDESWLPSYPSGFLTYYVFYENTELRKVTMERESFYP